MRGLIVKATSLESAEALCNVLWRYHPELSRSEDGGCQVTVDLGSDREIVAVLIAIHRYVVERNEAARLELEGRGYTLKPE